MPSPALSPTTRALGASYNRRTRPLPPPHTRPLRRSSVDAPSSSPTLQMVVLLVGRSVVATIGAVYSVLGLQDALLTVETRLWREQENTR